MLTIKRAPAIHDTQACCLGPTLYNIVIGPFNQGWYIVAIPDPGLLTICALDTDVTKNSNDICLWSAGHKKLYISNPKF